MSSEWKPVELQQYLNMLRERWVSALLTALLVLSAVATATLLQTPTYQSTNRMFVQTQAGSNIADLNSGVNFAGQQITSYADLATSPLVLDPVIEELSLDITALHLADDISTAVPPDTLILEITASSDDPAESAAIANATAASLQNAVSELETNGENSPVELTVISSAITPTSPASPDIARNAALGVILALLAGIGVAVARALVDNRIRSSQDVETSFDRSVIASIPAMRDTKHLPLIAARAPHSRQAEAYRELRTNLQFTGLKSDSKSVLVTSSLPGEGKSTSAINLAHSLAQAGMRVLLIDADLRRPSIAKYLGLEGNAGLTTVLIGEAEISDLAQPLEVQGLEVLASGPVPPNPSELLGTPEMEQVLQEAVAEYDYVVIDTAPLLAVTDAAVLSQMAGGTLVVAQSEQVRKPQLSAALEKLDAVEARVLGVLLNRVPHRVNDAYSYKYSYEPERPSRATKPHQNAVRKPPLPKRDRRLKSKGRRLAAVSSRTQNTRSRRGTGHSSATARSWPSASDSNGRHQ